MTLEHKFCPPQTRLVVANGSEIAGYASLFDRVDQGGDRVSHGAYAASLAKVAASGGRIKMLWQHDPMQPIGVWDEIREDDRGLFVKGRILTDVARGKEAAALVEAGAIDGLSIGYRTVKAAKSADRGRTLTELDLWEVSLVTFPMLPDARVDAKSEAPGDATLRELAALFADARVALRLD
ncbi:HK97 family phage prohead protease [Loktanella sp. SALINAS62]|uniref:HK97 family phage prohead protease n=1 Tax=Loktanella sp. SALINAS62 TaxID=2706124 RepID=UPI001B8AD0B2|nr:HK97 family phage prohead protease [Loktanella sp. SALINAS62]MBS1303595.1 HK97 family phage prohead protease [Loktanella sp. SALINAS62]